MSGICKKMVIARLLWIFFKNLNLFDWNIMAGLGHWPTYVVVGQT